MHYIASLKSNPRDANVFCDLGYSYLLQGKYRESEEALKQAIRVSPQHPKALNNLGMVYAAQGDVNAARLLPSARRAPKRTPRRSSPA
jgi:Flp pilus assembly protein TadD